MKPNKIIENYNKKPHLVILGAGASKDAFPLGDANGKKLPVMNEFISTLGLSDYIKRIKGVPYSDNIEEIYSWLYDRPQYRNERFVIEEEIREYFSNLTLPDHLTKYDLLILSLRKKDCIATFNWDGLLVQSYMRMRKITNDLPMMLFLHGNVDVGYCPYCYCDHKDAYGFLFNKCPICNKEFKSVPLLYPIKNKNYANQEFIKTQWDLLEKYLAKASIVSIYGYSAPISDKEAIDIFKRSYVNVSNKRPLDIIEIIESPNFDEKTISKAWLGLANIASRHLKLRRCIFESYMFLNPRRSLEFVKKEYLCGNWNVESSIKFTECDININNIITLEKKLKPLLDKDKNDDFDII